MKLSDHLLEDLLLGAELRVKGQEAESGKLALPGSVCPHRARSEWTGDRTPRPPVLLQKPGSEQAAVSRRVDGRSPANDGAGGPVRSVGNPSPHCWLPDSLLATHSLWLRRGLAGKVTLTCFIRSKSKASRATSFTLPTGFILERMAGCGEGGSRAGRAPPTWGQSVRRQAGCAKPPSAGRRTAGQARPSSPRLSNVFCFTSGLSRATPKGF